MTRDEIIITTAEKYGLDISDSFTQHALAAPDGIIEAGEYAGTYVKVTAAARKDPLVLEMFARDANMILPLGMLTHPVWETLDDAYILIPVLEGALLKTVGDPSYAAEQTYRYCKDAISVVKQMLLDK